MLTGPGGDAAGSALRSAGAAGPVVAALDCGTNSLRLLIRTREAELLRTMEIVRLGEGVDRTGVLSAAALARTGAALQRFAALCRQHGASRIRLVATSATRDAANRDVFSALVRDTLGVDPDVVTGAQEAALSRLGARDALTVRRPAVAGPRPAPLAPGAPVVVADIGGGSTELVRDVVPGAAARDGGAGAAADAVALDPGRAVSLQMGCVRLTERRLHSDPPTAAEVSAATADIDALLAAAADLPLTPTRVLLGLAGSVTTVVAHALDLPAYDSDRIHGAHVEAGAAAAAAADLLHRSRADRAALPFLHPGRVDVIGGGALVLSRLLAATGAGVLVASEHDILDGIAMGLVD